MWDVVKNYFEPKLNSKLSRFQLRDLVQQANEPIDNYVVRLKVQAQKCNFATPSVSEDNLIDQIIKGTHHSNVRKKLLECDPKTFTLDKAIDLARTFKATQLQLQQFTNSSRLGESVDAIHKGNRNKSNGKFHKSNKTEAKMCYFCGLPYHPKESCLAKKKYCNKCGKLGHWGRFVKTQNLKTFFTNLTQTVKRDISLTSGKVKLKIHLG